MVRITPIKIIPELEGEQSYFGDLLTMVIKDLLISVAGGATQIPSQVNPTSKWVCKEKEREREGEVQNIYLDLFFVLAFKDQ